MTRPADAASFGSTAPRSTTQPRCPGRNLPQLTESTLDAAEPPTTMNDPRMSGEIVHVRTFIATSAAAEQADAGWRTRNLA